MVQLERLDRPAVVPDYIKIQLLRNHPYFMKLFQKELQTEDFQLALVNQDYSLYNLITNPSDKVKRAIVLSDPIAIHLIDNPPQDLIDLVGTIKTFE